MSSRKLLRSLNVRLETGAIAPRVAEVNLDLVEETASGLTRVTDDGIIEIALEILSRRVLRYGVITGPKTVRDYCVMRYSELEHEVFACIFIDLHGQVIAVEELSRGTIDTASVSTRELLKRVLIHNAAAIILVHNHPSGDPSPSALDIDITKIIVAAFQLFNVRVVDHVVVAGGNFYSMGEKGALV